VYLSEKETTDKRLKQKTAKPACGTKEGEDFLKAEKRNRNELQAKGRPIAKGKIGETVLRSARKKKGPSYQRKSWVAQQNLGEGC